MGITLAFDVYGTLIDTTDVTTVLEKWVGDKATDLSSLWREKQLEYSFRRGLMQNYVDFSVVTRHALDYACHHLNVELSSDAENELMEKYRELKAFPDVPEGLKKMKEAGFRIFAFSNGSSNAVQNLLQNADIHSFFEGVVSVEDVRSFKPNPGVYAHFLRQSATTGSEAWMVSGNPFDVIGAISAGMRAAWVQRDKNKIFDPWGIPPTITVDDISSLGDSLIEITGS